MKKILVLLCFLSLSPLAQAKTTLDCDLEGYDGDLKIKEKVSVIVEENPLYIKILGSKHVNFSVYEDKTKDTTVLNSSTKEMWKISNEIKGTKENQKKDWFLQVEIDRTTGKIKIDSRFGTLISDYSGECKKQEKLKF